MKTIYLTGFMGSGKTTVGKLLGKELDMPVVDTDHLIEEKHGQRITEIFAQSGEEVFRHYETGILPELPSINTIVTTGGGMPVNEKNRRYMLQNGTVVFLNCPLDTIFKRLEGDQTRPLFDQNRKNEMKGLYQKRLSAYRQCHLEINIVDQPAEETVREILLRLNLQH